MSKSTKGGDSVDGGKTAETATLRRSTRTRSASLGSVESALTDILLAESSGTRGSGSGSSSSSSSSSSGRLGSGAANILKAAVQRTKAAITTTTTTTTASHSSPSSSSTAVDDGKAPVVASRATSVSLTAEELGDLVEEINAMRSSARPRTSPPPPDAIAVPTIDGDDDGDDTVARLSSADVIMNDLKKIYRTTISFTRRHNDRHKWKSMRNRDDSAFICVVLDYLRGMHIPADAPIVDVCLRRLFGIEMNEEIGGWESMRALDNWSSTRLVGLDSYKALMRDIKVIRSITPSMTTTTTSRYSHYRSNRRGRGGARYTSSSSSSNESKRSGGGRGNNRHGSSSATPT